MSDTYNIGPTVPGLFAAHESRFKEAADEIDRLRATVERLLRYAYHEEECRVMKWNGGIVCDCGYEELMEKLEESK